MNNLIKNKLNFIVKLMIQDNIILSIYQILLIHVHPITHLSIKMTLTMILMKINSKSFINFTQFRIIN